MADNCRTPTFRGSDVVMTEADCTEELRARVDEAIKQAAPLALVGSGSKSFLGPRADGTPLDVRGHRGVVHYAPEELVLTVRAGTPVAEVENLLAGRGQMLAFEPPHFGPGATVGGTFAAGLSGPRRAAVGSARDFVLGMRFISGRGDVLRVGGEVIKNVAGYDLSRLMVGAFGTLGLILDVSLKVLPRPRAEQTLVQDVRDHAQAIGQLCAWAGKPLPITATCVEAHRMSIRLAGAESAVQHAARQLGGETLADGATFWRDLREQQLAFFDDPRPLWRLSLPPATPPLSERLAVTEDCLVEWGGAQRWIRTGTDAESVYAAARTAGGHATLYRNGSRDAACFQALPPALLEIHKRLKRAFDPHGIFNPGRMYKEF